MLSLGRAMSFFTTEMTHLIEFIQFVGYFGYFVLFLIIFLESFPPTFFLPGDSLLFITGFLASQGHFSLVLLIAVLYTASILGYMFSYAMGKRLGDVIEASNDKYWFKKKHLDYTAEFYKKYGTQTVILGRFIPIVRSFNPTLAGAVEMDYKKFFRMVLIGGFLWAVGLTTIGYYLGQVVPNADKYLTLIVVCIIVVSLFPAIYEFIHKMIRKSRKMN